MMKEIKLNIDKNMPSLNGETYGKSIYKANLKFKIKNFEEPTKIIFPDHIESISDNFINGLFSEIIDKIGLEKTLALYEIETINNDNLKQFLEK